MNVPVDAVTTEVVANHLLGVAEEMWAMLVRSAYSVNVKERFDCSTGIFDANGNVIALPSKSIPIHLSSLDGVVASVLRAFPTSEMAPGDMFIANDPYYGGGSHLMDYTVVSPVFDANDQLVAFVSNLAHHSDIGGRVPGSQAMDNETLFEEGLRIPPLRLCRRGRIADDVMTLLAINSRVPVERYGDILAQIAANKLGVLRIADLAGRYGSAGLQTYLAEMLNYTERWLFRKVETLPNISVEFEDRIDHAGVASEPILLHVKVTKSGSKLMFDFSESADQVAGALNVPPCGVKAVVRCAVKTLLDPSLPANGGLDRVIEITTRPGSILDPFEPAATGERSDTCNVLGDVVAGALSSFLPSETMAASGPHHGWRIAGVAPGTGKYFIDYESFAGALGASSYADGMDAVRIWASGASNAPIEALEAEYPFVHRRYELIQDSGGAGRCRGGMGTRRDVEVHGTKLRATFHGLRQFIAAKGRDGGLPGSPGGFVLNPDTEREQRLPWFASRRPIEDGDVLSVRTPGGGGMGDPRARDRAIVERDLREGRISVEQAQSIYGLGSGASGTR